MYDQSKVEEIKEAIIEAITQGEPCYKACAAHGVPDGTFWLWLSKSASLAEKYTRAKEKGCDRKADDIERIADDMDIPADHKRIMVDARKWTLSKLVPKKYGDKIDVDLSGGLKIVAVQDDVL